MTRASRPKPPAAWVPSSYLAEGIPFALVIWVAGTMFKDLGYSDAEITLGTASIGIAWSLKPLWAPFLEMYRTKKFWVLATELVIAALVGAVALALHSPHRFRLALVGLWALAFASATQDVCVDGVYITTLDEKKQAGWIGVQGMFWNGGRIFATAAVVWVAGALKDRGHEATTAWTYALAMGGAAMALLGLYHLFMLPTGSLTEHPQSARDVARTFAEAVRAFFEKKALLGMLVFVFLYRIGEGFLLVEAPLFMQAPLRAGGLGMTLGQKAFVDGTAISTSRPSDV